MSDNKRPYSLKPRLFGQPLWWWLGTSHSSDLFGHERKTALRSRPGVIWRRFCGVRPRPIGSWKLFYQRGRKGYSVVDIFSLDWYLLSWLPEAIDDLREDSHGHPVGVCDHRHDGSDETGDCGGAEIWKEILIKMADGLRSGREIHNSSYYVVGDSWENNKAREDALHAEFEEAMDLFKKWFFGLWS